VSVTSIDVSAAALAVARKNAAANGVEVRFLEGDLFAPVAGEVFDAVVSNPPYVPAGDALMPEVRDYEPAQALFAGSDGLTILRRIIEAAPRYLPVGGLLALEMGAGQWSAVQELCLQARFEDVRHVRDLQQIPRVALGQRMP
jgi:release factor glutamine methyltransferase